MTDALENAVADLKGKIAARVALLKENESWREVQRLYAGLGVLEELCGMPKTELTALLGITDDAIKIEKHEFAGLPPLEAAKKYLRKIAPKQRAASLDEIVVALEAGSLKANRDDLRTSLSRSTVEIYKAGEDIYGLVDNFPHIKRGSPGRKKSTAAVVEEIMSNRTISLNKAVELAADQARAEAQTLVDTEHDK